MSYHTAQLKGKTFQYRTAAGEQNDGSRVHQVICVDWLIQSWMEWWRGKLQYVSVKHITKKRKANDNKASSADDLEPCLISYLSPAALRCSIKWSCKNASKNNISLTVIQKFGDETVTFFFFAGTSQTSFDLLLEKHTEKAWHVKWSYAIFPVIALQILCLAPDLKSYDSLKTHSVFVFQLNTHHCHPTQNWDLYKINGGVYVLEMLRLFTVWDLATWNSSIYALYVSEPFSTLSWHIQE